MFGLLGLYVVVKGTISSFSVVFGCLKISRGISLAFNKLASVTNLGYFCSSNVFFQFFKEFFFHTDILNIFFLQERTVYLLNDAVGGLM